MGMACFGEYLLKGLGGPSVPALGLVYTSRAAEAGSELADFQLAKVTLTRTRTRILTLILTP